MGDRIEVLLGSSLIGPTAVVLARVEPLREGEATVGEADYTLWYNMDGEAPRRCRFSPLAEDIRVSESGEGGHLYDVTDGHGKSGGDRSQRPECATLMLTRATASLE